MMRYIIFDLCILILLVIVFWFQLGPSPLPVNSSKTRAKEIPNDNSSLLASHGADYSSVIMKNTDDPNPTQVQDQATFSETEYTVAEQYYHQPLTDEEKQELDKERQQRAKLELDGRMRELMESGEGGEHWLPQLNTLHEKWQRMAVEMDIDATINHWDCFSAGCAATVTYEQYENIKKLWQQIYRSPASESWQGNTFLSGAVEKSSGVMQATWILTPPIPFNENDDAQGL